MSFYGPLLCAMGDYTWIDIEGLAGPAIDFCEHVCTVVGLTGMHFDM